MTIHNGDGLYVLTGEMPCAPADLKFMRYMLPRVLVNVVDDAAEAEEAAARIIAFSQDAGRWVGVNFKAIGTQYNTDGPEVESVAKDLGDATRLVFALGRLVRKQLLREERIQEEGDGESNIVLFPTRELVQRILDAQSAPATAASSNA